MKDEQFLIIYSEAVRQCYYNINCIYVRRRRTKVQDRERVHECRKYTQIALGLLLFINFIKPIHFSFGYLFIR